ncbi:MAG: damage-inducible protein [Planctomycetaceae bacterium]
MNNGTLFHFDQDKTSFEDLGEPNGATHWHEQVLMDALGYTTKPSFRKALNRAKQACLSLNMTCEEHFLLQVDGDHILTRFGCYLVAMNGDPRKPAVAAAQAYFAAIADTFQSHIESADAVDRILIREEITDGQKSLASTAKAHGVKNYAFFQNKGYLGMYNMSLQRLIEYKGVPKSEKLIDRMNKSEMAAHLFRITQTDEKIKREKISGQVPLEQAAFDVGRKVRKTMTELGGTAPEDLPLSENVKDSRKKLKDAGKKLKAIDKKRNS